MTPAARLQAAIEILDLVIDAARGEGAPADTLVTRYFKTRPLSGRSADRRIAANTSSRTARRSFEPA